MSKTTEHKDKNYKSYQQIFIFYLNGVHLAKPIVKCFGLSIAGIGHRRFVVDASLCVRNNCIMSRCFIYLFLPRILHTDSRITEQISWIRINTYYSQMALLVLDLAIMAE